MGRKVLIFGSGAVIGALVAVAIGCLQIRSPKVVVREPAAPGESTLTYTPPPEATLSAEMAAKAAPMLLTMISPKIVKVKDGVYVAMGYALGNVAMVVTDDGLVIVDTTEREEAAKKIMAEFRKISDQPVRYVVYTHFHPDHTQGTRAFMGPGTRVIATRAFLYWIAYQNELLGTHHRRSRATQAGLREPEWAFDMPISRNPFLGAWKKPEVVMPTITFEDDYSFTLGGKRFELFATQGETEDHLAMWMPDERVLFVGDLYYKSFPNLSTPMLESRPVQGWIDSLTRFIGMKPEYLVLGHTEPLQGADLIAEHLTNYRDAVEYVHDETVRCINEGKTVDQAVAEIKLPERLAKLDYLNPAYGRVDWSVRGIYHGYKGWYDGQGTALNPLPPQYRARELVQLAGGADKILARAIELQKNGEHQLTAELCDLVIAANPADKLAHRIKAASMQYMAYGFNNLNCFGFYRSAYSLEMKAAGEPPRSEKSSDAQGVSK
ncbi:MAG TPA: alkyl/aryl-sulfatase [bacterium]|nr:alkyl/aryl-sulfatase [bacterium]